MNGVVAHRAPATLLQRVRWDVLGARKLQAVHPISNCVNNIGFMEDVRRAHAAVQAAGEARASASAPPSEAMMAGAKLGRGLLPYRPCRRGTSWAFIEQ